LSNEISSECAYNYDHDHDQSVSTSHILLLLALLLPLSLDTFILCAALGMAGLPRRQQVRTSLILAASEAGMPAIGALLGTGFGHVLGRFAGYTAALVIALTGIIMLWPGQNEDKEQHRLRLLAHARGLAILDLGISISIDEVGVGLSLGLLHVPLALVMVWLGVQAFLAAMLALRLGSRIGERLREGGEKLAGFILVAVGVGLVLLKLAGLEL
jgi:manganese efflux pump family protein